MMTARMVNHALRLFMYEWSPVFSSTERGIFMHTLITRQYKYFPLEVVEYENVHKYGLPSMTTGFHRMHRIGII